MQIKRAFIDVNGDFAVFREKGGKKKWFYMRIVNGKQQIFPFNPKHSQDFSWGDFLLHIHNNWLYRKNHTVKAIKIAGSDIDLDMVIVIMEVQKQKMARKLDRFRHEHPRRNEAQ